jgi:thymidylate synthase/dihydrofolate reductase
MGRATYFSIQEHLRPLKNRLNLVVTHQPQKYQNQVLSNLKFTTFDDMVIPETDHQVFIIGGQSIYQQCLAKYHIDRLYVTLIDKDYQCDRTFNFPTNYKMESNYSPSCYSETEKCHYRFVEYVRTDETHDESQYLNLINDVIQHGNLREDRTKVGTKGVFGRQIRFNIGDCLPLLTTKFVPFKMIVKELLWFLNGQTNNKILQDQGVHIWDGNTTRAFLDQRGLGHYQEGDVGPMYGFQWRHFGATYNGCTSDYTGLGIDQLENVIDLLKTDPFSRRIAITTYNVNDLEKGVLHPCHGIYTQFYVEQRGDHQYLSCHMTQRSVDCGCGLPFNIASYAILTHIIATKVGMHPDQLIISMGDTHIYDNHLDLLSDQIKRTPYPFPKIHLKEIKDKPWNQLTVDDFELVGYLSHPPIKLIMNI